MAGRGIKMARETEKERQIEREVAKNNKNKTTHTGAASDTEG